MSTREIAELTGMEHGHVLRDARLMLDQLGDEPNLDHVREEKDARAALEQLGLHAPEFSGTYRNKKTSRRAAYPSNAAPARG